MSVCISDVCKITLVELRERMYKQLSLDYFDTTELLRIKILGPL